MAKQIQTTLVDDLDGTEGAETIKFSVDGDKYEIDLNKKNGATFRGVFAPFVEKCRKVGGAVANSDANQMREWAKSQGMEVPVRGRLPKEIVAAYKTAHPQADQAAGKPAEAKNGEKKGAKGTTARAA